jgi:hypothetical protein
MVKEVVQVTAVNINRSCETFAGDGQLSIEGSRASYRLHTDP